VPELYAAMKIVGAIYLVWLGIDMMRSRASVPDASAVTPKSARRAFVESVVVELLNPKVAIFFIAFLPQFVDPGAGLPIWAQFLILGTFVNLVFSLVDVVTIVIASTVMSRLKGEGGLGRKLVRIGGGTILVGLGARLALDRS
jgi:threonine/homoserine/homoserine lactone efflux protein